MKSKVVTYFGLFLIGIVILFFANLFIGSLRIPFDAILDILLGNEVAKPTWKTIILVNRFPAALTALFSGAGISVSGLLLQTAFRNPLADSNILGVSAGASLGVAIVVFIFGGFVGNIGGFDISSSMTLVFGAFLGAALILAIIIGFASVVKNNIMLLIIGIMVGYLTSSIITLFTYWSTNERVFSFVMWGMGNFSNVYVDQLPFYLIVISAGLILSLILIKPLNALLLGDRYATNLGVNIKRTRFLLLVCAGLLTAITTAYCGPISFIGLAVPHIARLLLGTSNHKLLLPSTMLIGAFVALLCNLISSIPSSAGMIPLNAITPILGAPVIIYIIINQKKIQYFN